MFKSIVKEVKLFLEAIAIPKEILRNGTKDEAKALIESSSIWVLSDGVSFKGAFGGYRIKLRLFLDENFSVEVYSLEGERKTVVFFANRWEKVVKRIISLRTQE